jgi:hypothetical protein
LISIEPVSSSAALATWTKGPQQSVRVGNGQ